MVPDLSGAQLLQNVWLIKGNEHTQTSVFVFRASLEPLAKTLRCCWVHVHGRQASGGARASWARWGERVKHCRALEVEANKGKIWRSVTLAKANI